MSRSREGGWRVTTLRMTSHTGTHMDAPAHLIDDGATIDAIAPSRLVLPATLLHCGGAVIGADRLEGVDVAGRAVLLRTRGSELPRDGFSRDYPYLEPAAAELLRDRGAMLLGIDYLSVDEPAGSDSHRTLLGAGVPIVEDLFLEGVEEGDYVLICLPLLISMGDGAPVRALLAPLE